MTRSALRILLTILMYSGVVIFLLPYVRGQISTGILFMIVGLSLAVVSGLLRCYLTEGECSDRTFPRPSP